MIDPTVKNALTQSISDLVNRLQTGAGLTEAEVNALIATWVDSNKATVGEAGTGTGSKLVDIDGAAAVAQFKIDEWVGAAPEALNTLQEFAEALNNNPDVVDNIINELALKATKVEVDEKIDALGNASKDLSTELANFLSTDATVLQGLTSGTHKGLVSLASTGILDQYPTADHDNVKGDNLVSLEAQVIAWWYTELTGVTDQLTYTFPHGDVKPVVSLNDALVPAAQVDISVADELTLSGVTIADGDAIELKIPTDADLSGNAGFYRQTRVVLTASDGAQRYHRTIEQIDTTGTPEILGTAPYNEWNCDQEDIAELAQAITDAFNAA